MSRKDSELRASLQCGVDALGIDVSIDALMTYLQLLDKWNHAYNLTAVREITAMVVRHILDSLAIVPWVKGDRVLDVGTGAGLPGIPLALACPKQQLVLLDSNGKKIRFLHEVKRVLGLTQVEIIQIRAESYHPKEGFDTVVSRAFSELQQMVVWTEHLVRSSGIWLAMKGRYPEDELRVLQYPYQVQTYQVADTDDERCCVIIRKESSWRKS